MKINEQDYLQGIQKQKSIRAFERLTTLTFQKGWKGRLDDRTIPGITKCIRIWLELSGFHCKSSGNIVEGERGRDNVVVEVSLTSFSVLTAAQKSLKQSIVRQGGIYLVCHGLSDFFEKFDDLFDN